MADHTNPKRPPAVSRGGARTIPMLVTLDRGGSVPLHRQIYLTFRRAILEARFPAGKRLPSTRSLAQDLGVSRTTVLGAYDQLAAEGFLKSRAGGGSRVTGAIAAPRDRRGGASKVDLPRARQTPPRAPTASGARRACVPFALGIPAVDAFPVGTWARLTARHWREDPRSLMLPDDGPGYRPLREAIAEYAYTSRGVRCTADQIIVSAGAQQGIALAARLLLKPGDQVWLEEPGFPPARAAFTAVGAAVVPVPVDEEGLNVAMGRKLAPKAGLAFVTPSFQAPMGTVMSIARRVALLDWAATAGGWVLEDDYNGEFRYDGRPLSSMQGLEHAGAGRVIFLGTFSKTIFPALRLGFLVVPPELAESFADARVCLDRHSPVIEQAVLADFIQEGHFARHVRNMRRLYQERQQRFVALARQEVGDLLRVEAAPAGMRLLGWLPPEIRDVDVVAEAERRGIELLPLSRFCLIRPRRNALILGYAPFTAPETERGLRALAQCIRACARHRAGAPEG